VHLTNLAVGAMAAGLIALSSTADCESCSAMETVSSSRTVKVEETEA